MNLRVTGKIINDVTINNSVALYKYGRFVSVEFSFSDEYNLDQE